MKSLKITTIALLALFTFSACNNDDDHSSHNHQNEEEVITTVTYTLTNAANSNDVVTLTFKDLDGDGPNVGTTTVSGNLKANTTYNGAIKFLNETENPAEDITTEVQAEGKEHEIFYTTTVGGVTINKTDNDTDGNPLGLVTKFITTNGGTGSLTIVLKHEPTKPNNGTASGAGGSTDAQVTFNVTVVNPV